MKKKKIIIIIIMVVIVFYLLAIVYSMYKFKYINPLSTCLGITKILFTNEQYTSIQEYPNKVILSKANYEGKNAYELLDEYMYNRGFSKVERLGSTISYYNGIDYENIHFIYNKYYSAWEWQ